MPLMYMLIHMLLVLRLIVTQVRLRDDYYHVVHPIDLYCCDVIVNEMRDI
jgi:hypothetical protein